MFVVWRAGGRAPLSLVILASAWSSCSFDAQVGPDTPVGCYRDDQCFNGRVCDLKTNRCVTFADPIALTPTLTPVEGKAGTLFALSFRLEEAVTSLRVTVRDLAGVSVGEFSPINSGPDWRLTWTPTGTEPEGTLKVTADITRSGQRVSSDLPMGTLSVDFTPPRPGDADLRLELDNSNALLQQGLAYLARAVTLRTRLQISVPLDEAPGVGTTAAVERAGAVLSQLPLTLDPAASRERTLVFTGILQGVVTDGPAEVWINVADRVGNEARRRLSLTRELLLDTTPPVAPAFALPEHAVYRRAPQGDIDGGLPAWTVRFSPDTFVEGGYLVLSATQGGTVGRYLVADDGGLPPVALELEGDVVSLRGKMVDFAGNASPAADVVDEEYVGVVGTAQVLDGGRVFESFPVTPYTGPRNRRAAAFDPVTQRVLMDELQSTSLPEFMPFWWDGSAATAAPRSRGNGQLTQDRFRGRVLSTFDINYGLLGFQQLGANQQWDAGAAWGLPFEVPTVSPISCISSYFIETFGPSLHDVRPTTGEFVFGQGGGYRVRTYDLNCNKEYPDPNAWLWSPDGGWTPFGPMAPGDVIWRDAPRAPLSVYRDVHVLNGGTWVKMTDAGFPSSMCYAWDPDLERLLIVPGDNGTTPASFWSEGTGLQTSGLVFTDGGIAGCAAQFDAARRRIVVFSSRMFELGQYGERPSVNLACDPATTQLPATGTSLLGLDVAFTAGALGTGPDGGALTGVAVSLLGNTAQRAGSFSAPQASLVSFRGADAGFPRTLTAFPVTLRPQGVNGRGSAQLSTSPLKVVYKLRR